MSGWFLELREPVRQSDVLPTNLPTKLATIPRPCKPLHPQTRREHIKNPSLTPSFPPKTPLKALKTTLQNKKSPEKFSNQEKLRNFAPHLRTEPPSGGAICHPEERCRSGRSGRSRKPLYPYGYPGFESLSFRNLSGQKSA